MLKNSEGNCLVIEDVDMYNVTAKVFVSEEKVSSLDPNFEKSDFFTVHIPQIKQRMKETAASGANGKKIWDNILTLAYEELVLAAASTPPLGFPEKSYPHDWDYPVLG